MDIHYIYDANIDKNCLCQGDILKRSPELIEELSTIHPHYATQLNYKSQVSDLLLAVGKLR